MTLKFILHTVDFFSLPMKKMTIENHVYAGRTYFVYKGRVVAVAVTA